MKIKNSFGYVVEVSDPPSNMAEPYEHGRRKRIDGYDFDMCPYNLTPVQIQWIRGWIEADPRWSNRWLRRAIHAGLWATSGDSRDTL